MARTSRGRPSSSRPPEDVAGHSRVVRPRGRVNVEYEHPTRPRSSAAGSSTLGGSSSHEATTRRATDGVPGPRGGVTPPPTFPTSGVSQAAPRRVQQAGVQQPTMPEQRPSMPAQQPFIPIQQPFIPAQQAGGHQSFMSAQQAGGQQPFMRAFPRYVHPSMMMHGYQQYMAPTMWGGMSGFDGSGMTQPMMYPTGPFPLQEGFSPTPFPPFYVDPTVAGTSSSGGFRPQGPTEPQPRVGFSRVLGTTGAQPSRGSRADETQATPTGIGSMPHEAPATQDQGAGPTDEELLFENPYLEALAAKVVYYCAEEEGVEVEVPGQPGVTVGGVRVLTDPIDDVVDDAPSMTEEEELALADTLDVEITGNRNGGIGVGVPADPSHKHGLTLCMDGAFADPTAISLGGDIVKRVMRHDPPKLSWRNFTKEEQKDAWHSFQQHYQWTDNEHQLIEICFKKIAQKSFDLKFVLN